MAVDRDPALEIRDREPRVAALRGEPQEVDANPPLARRLDAQRREPCIEMLEAANAVAAVLTRRFDFLVRACVAVFLQPQRERTVVDLHVA